MPPRRRLTVALVVTGTVAHEIDGLRRALGAAALERIAPHCTLIPPLNVREEHLDAVLDHIRSAAGGRSPVAVTLGPPGTFWPRTPVLYLAVGGDLAAIAALRNELGSGSLAPPAGRVERDFVPHVTLDQRIDPARLPHALEAMADYRAEYCFERVSLLEQTAGHHWRPLADAALARPAIAGRGSLELEISVVERADPAIAAWADEQWSQYSRDSYGASVGPISPFAVVVRAAGRPVAFAEGEVRGPVLRLGRAIVGPEWRNQGVGSQLLRALERLGRERGCARIRLETRSGGRAQHFYAERGFSVTAALPAWREERDFVLMERGLHPPPPPTSADPPAPTADSGPGGP